MATPTFSGTTITIPSAGTSFDELATALASNPTFGTAFETVIKINATVSFASGARLTKGTSVRNTIIFDATDSRFRMVSASFTQANKGVLDFTTEGFLILEGRGYVGSSQSQFQIGIEAENLTFIDAHRTSQSDLAFRSNNTISSFNISKEFNVVFNNTAVTSFGLLIDSTLVNIPEAVNFLVGGNATNPASPILNGPNDQTFPAIAYPLIAGSYYNVTYHRNNPSFGTAFFKGLTFNDDAEIRILTWGAGIAYFDSTVLPENFSSNFRLQVSSIAAGASTVIVRYKFAAPDYDSEGGFSVRIWDDTGEMHNDNNSVIGDRMVVWQELTQPDNNAAVPLVKRLNANVRLRKAGFQDLNLSYSEYNSDVEFLAPPVSDAEYSNTSPSITEVSTVNEFYDLIRQYLASNLDQEINGVSKAGNTLTVGAYSVVADATAASLFAFNGTTITIKATSIAGNVTATGAATITTVNGAAISGIVSDANGTSGLLELS